MIGDRHVHTRFSYDCKAPEEDVIRCAISQGMKDICITDHCDPDLGDDWLFDVGEYAKTWEGLKEKYKDRINIHIGIEMGLNPLFNDQIEKYLNAYDFEQVIGSIHTMSGKDPYYRDDFDMDDHEFYRLYFETALNCIKNSTGFNIFGHFDYVTRYAIDKKNGYIPEENAEHIDEILKELIKRDIALELNTGGLRKGIDFVHPHDHIMTRFKELGGKYITVGSDAHFAEHVGAGFDSAEELMKKYGLDESNIIGYR